MTDTTDMAALRKRLQSAISQHEMMMGCVMGISRVDPMYQQYLDALNELEAERQRAGTQIEDLEKRLRYTEETLIAANDLLAVAEAENAALKAKLANPVVLPHDILISRDAHETRQCAAAGYNDAMRDAKGCIIEAGFTVKGE